MKQLALRPSHLMSSLFAGSNLLRLLKKQPTNFAENVLVPTSFAKAMPDRDDLFWDWTLV
jgi:hypothetical protein